MKNRLMEEKIYGGKNSKIFARNDFRKYHKIKYFARPNFREFGKKSRNRESFNGEISLIYLVTFFPLK